MRSEIHPKFPTMYADFAKKTPTIKLSMIQYTRSSQELITVQVQQLNLPKYKQPKACNIRGVHVRQTDPALKHDHDQIRNKTAE